MNRQTLVTLFFVAIAALLTVAAVTTRSGGPSSVPAFSDQGEAFYPEFTDPLRAASLEVVQFDAAKGEIHPFKVQVKNGKWSIPSHYDYPADGADRLAKTAAALIDLRKDSVQSDRLQDHGALGVIDPLDETITGTEGRGTRVTLRDASESVLADFIVGRAVENRTGFRYLRLPGQKRVYTVKIDIDPSVKFADWIETNLLDLSAPDLAEILVSDYSIEEQTGSINRRGEFRLVRRESAPWALEGLAEGEKLDTTKVSAMTNALSQIKITGVRPKPAGLTSDLRSDQGIQLDLPTQLSLQAKGYFVTGDGLLVSNEGEISVGTNEGVRYVLRFGEVLIGEGIEVSAGFEEEEPGEQPAEMTGPENRYLFVTAQFDETLLGAMPAPPAPPSAGPAPAEAGTPPDEGPTAPTTTLETPSAPVEGTIGAPPVPALDPLAQAAYDEALKKYEQEKSAWESRRDEGMKKASDLNARFAPWYYVISAADYAKIKVSRVDVLTKAP